MQGVSAQVLLVKACLQLMNIEQILLYIEQKHRIDQAAAGCCNMCIQALVAASLHKNGLQGRSSDRGA